MRLQGDSGPLQPLAPVRGIPAELPELQVGQAFTARIQEALPDNIYKALVAGRQLTLQLPEGAAAGDTLELVVVDRTPKTLIAQKTTNSGVESATPQPYPFTKISDAGKMIGQLLLPESEAPQPAPLNRGQPLLPQAPTEAADLVPTLAKAVSQSGLFYEAHQAKWVAGQHPLEALRAEPQGRLPVASGEIRESTGGEKADKALSSSTQATHSEPANRKAGPETTTSSGQTQAAQTNLPDDVRPIVQQQLDAVASQRLSWHGEVWPGQVMDWEIQRDQTDEREARDATNDFEPSWNTTLRLSMPQLGTVDATLQILGNKLRLQIASPSDDAVSRLKAQLPSLVDGLAKTGLQVQPVNVGREEV